MLDIDIEKLMKVYARNCVNKYRIAQDCRAYAAEIDLSIHPMMEDIKNTFEDIAYELEQI